MPKADAQASAPWHTARERLRVALYSHDTMGLGHMRRNLLIAQALAGPPMEANVLLIAGAQDAALLSRSPGVDCLTLPSLYKGVDGRYQSRFLGLSLPELIALRGRVIHSALEAFAPDLFVVDNVPRGAVSELDSALGYLGRRGYTRCILGLRDILDDPLTVRREWRQASNERAILDYFDAVWIYGDPVVYDPVHEYGFGPELAAKVRFTGYFDHRKRLAPDALVADDTSAADLPPGRLALCVVGGGQDGAPLAEAFADADLPPGTSGVILTGPHMPLPLQQRLQLRAAEQGRLRVIDFLPEATTLLRRADRVVAMGGYNTIWEVLSFEKPALIVPRVKPRREQLIRAQRLRDMGLLDMFHPDDLSPRALAQWLASEVGPRPSVYDRIDFRGLERLPSMAMELIDSHDRQRRSRHAGTASSRFGAIPLPLSRAS